MSSVNVPRLIKAVQASFKSRTREEDAGVAQATGHIVAAIITAKSKNPKWEVNV